jgi:hypothetical protein
LSRARWLVQAARQSEVKIISNKERGKPWKKGSLSHAKGEGEIGAKLKVVRKGAQG